MFVHVLHYTLGARGFLDAVFTHVTGLRFVVVMGTTGNVLNEYHGLMKHRKITNWKKG